MTYQSKAPIFCTVCGIPAVARKLCKKHYYKARRMGEIDKHSILKPEDVFESKIDKSGSCWIWTGTKNSYGYGIFLLPGEIPVRAHRYAFEFFNDMIIPKDWVVMHTCDNPPCVNPAHLKLGTKNDNNKDTANKRRHNYGLDHWNGRLSDKMVEDIRKSQEQTRVLAIFYNVCTSHIYRIRHGQARK